MNKKNSPEVFIYNPANIIELVREVGYAQDIDDTTEFILVGEVANRDSSWWSVSITRASANDVLGLKNEIIWLNYLSRADWMKIFNKATEIKNEE